MAKTTTKDVEKMVANLGTTTKQVDYARTGCLMLDLLCGGGRGLGIPFGGMFSIVADTQIGKSFLANELIAKNYWEKKDKLLFNYDDVERGNSFDTESLYGVDIMGNSPYQSDTIQKLDTNLKLFLDAKEKKKKMTHGIYVVDSLDFLNCDANLAKQEKRVNAHVSGKDFSEGSYDMEKQKFLSGHLIPNNGQRVVDSNVLVVIISQIRDKINAMPFTPQYTISGGKAKEFAIHNRIFLKRKAKITKTVDGQDYVVGYYVEASLQKARSPRPERKAYYTMYTDYGINDIESSLTYLFDLRDNAGKLKTEANSIAWNISEDCEPKEKDNVLAWVEKHGLLDDMKAKKDGNWRYNLSYIEEYVFTLGTKEQQADWTKTFGESYALETLCTLIDNDPAMKEELDKRTYDKWEAIEAQCRTPLKRKYG